MFIEIVDIDIDITFIKLHIQGTTKQNYEAENVVSLLYRHDALNNS